MQGHRSRENECFDRWPCWVWLQAQPSLGTNPLNCCIIGFRTSPAIAPTCSGILETGDPVVGTGFTEEASTFRQGPTPNGTQVADGFYQPEDEALLPWFMRLNASPAQLAQSGTNGRYSFMGDLNQFAVFHSAPPACTD